MSTQDPDRGQDQEIWGNSLPLFSSGIPGLDVVLGGGIARGALILVVGPPGSGKTTLSNQIAFTAAHAGRRAVVVTALSEPSSKLIAHLRTFTFYDDALVGTAIQFMSIEQFLPSGMNVTGDELIAIARQTRADLLILDGFRGVRGADVDPQAARQFLYDVGTTLSALGTTTLISSETDARDPAFFPEATTADVIIGLEYSLMEGAHRRGLEIMKVRGGEPKAGIHALALTQQGVHVFPRLESQIARHPIQIDPNDGDPAEPRSDQESNWAAVDADAAAPAADTPTQGEASAVRAFGIPELDVLLGGGLTRGTSTLLVGSLGTGKTLLGLHFCSAGLRAGEPVLFLGFRESRAQLLQKVRPFAFGDIVSKALTPGGGLTLHQWNPVDLHPDIVAARLLEALDRTGSQRLVIDSIAELEHAIVRSGERERVSDFLAALLIAVRTRGVTALLIREHQKTIASASDLWAGPISILAENVLLLQQLEYRSKLHRVLSVVKMRFSGHDTQVHEFAIRPPAGIELLGHFKEDGQVFTALTQPPATNQDGEGSAQSDQQDT